MESCDDQLKTQVRLPREWHQWNGRIGLCVGFLFVSAIFPKPPFWQSRMDEGIKFESPGVQQRSSSMPLEKKKKKMSETVHPEKVNNNAFI